jgi:DnaJ-class molecular chaperone
LNSQALCGCSVEIPALSPGGVKSTLNLSSKILKPNSIEKIQGRGLPYPKEPSKRGDLLINFDIQFPDKLTQAQKDIIFDLLPNK